MRCRVAGMGMVNEPMVGVSYARPSYASNPAPANGATPSGKDPVQIVEAMSKKVSFTLLVEITKFSSLVAFFGPEMRTATRSQVRNRTCGALKA